jgi:hypothetical protein
MQTQQDPVCLHFSPKTEWFHKYWEMVSKICCKHTYNRGGPSYIQASLGRTRYVASYIHPPPRTGQALDKMTLGCEAAANR